MDAFIGPIEDNLENEFFTPPGVIAILIRRRRTYAGYVKVIGDATSEPAAHVAISREASYGYSLLLIMPRQTCQIGGRPEVRFYALRRVPKLQVLEPPVTMPFPPIPLFPM